MDIRQLRYYKEIVDQGSISKASEALHMAQPPLSMLLKSLEERYGAILIKRYREKWEVTNTGWELYAHAKKMLEQMEMFDMKMMYMQQGEIGELRIGIAYSCMYFIGSTLKQFTTMYPKIQIQLVEAPSKRIEKLLRANEIDLAIILAPDNQSPYEVVKLPSSTFALGVPISWKARFLAPNFTMNQLTSYPFIWLEVMKGHAELQKLFLQKFGASAQLNVVVKSKDIMIAKYLVAEEVGVCVLPKRTEVMQDNIHYVDLPFIDSEMEPMLLYKKEAALSMICRNFITLFTKSL